MAALEITGLQKKFGGVVALNGVDLSIDPTKITGIIGPNGSGKTTLFNVIVGAQKPSGGRVSWRGNDITGRSTARIARQGLVRTFQQAMSFSGLSVHENVTIAYEHGPSPRDRREKMEILLKKFSILSVYRVWVTKRRAQCPLETFAGWYCHRSKYQPVACSTR